MTALPPTVALVDETGHISLGTLTAVAGALNEQIANEFGAAWHLHANVVAIPKGQRPGPFQWAVHIQHALDQPGALGYHSDLKSGQPVAYVEYTGTWTVTVAHEVLEMLADPAGMHTHAARLPLGLEDRHADFGLPHPTSRVEYLREVCDPCEATSYEVAGISLSDFLLPSWYRSTATGNPTTHASMLAPRVVDDGGYVSFANNRHHWWQVFNQGGQLQVNDLGVFDGRKFRSLREFTDHHAREFRAGLHS